jgi:two-component system OmpR family response regulator/two-component system response regulator RstA
MGHSVLSAPIILADRLRDRPRVLLVEDDERLSELVRSYLDSNGFDVTVEYRGDRVLGRVQAERPDLLILDLGLPGQSGFTVCREVRATHSVPILILTARNSDIDQVLGLELGADDFVIKPVEPRVLVARIHALLRRSRASAAQEHGKLQFGSLYIDTAARAVRVGNEEVALSSNEFDLLLYLATHPGEIQSREKLYQQLYRRDYDGVDRTLDVRISHLRRKLGDTGEPERIKTVWGHGYLFVPSAW